MSTPKMRAALAKRLGIGEGTSRLLVPKELSLHGRRTISRWPAGRSCQGSWTALLDDA
jgi:hypothetical protein